MVSDLTKLIPDNTNQVRDVLQAKSEKYDKLSSHDSDSQSKQKVGVKGSVLKVVLSAQWYCVFSQCQALTDYLVSRKNFDFFSLSFGCTVNPQIICISNSGSN